MSEDVKAKKARPGGCIFRVFTPLCIRASGQWIHASRDDPVIADLSDCEDASIQYLMQNGAIETADGEPFNKPTGKRSTDKPCPCNK